jgi:hypothetical protein
MKLSMRTAYRLMLVALVIALVGLGANLIEQHNRASIEERTSSELDQQVERASKTLADAEKQRDEMKAILAKARESLAKAKSGSAASASSEPDGKGQ